MKKYFSFLLLLCYIGNSLLGTDIGGTLNKDSTLTLDLSPYQVTSTITIHDGFTLNVDSGVVLQFHPSTQVRVYGNLIANYATFTSNQALPDKNNWGGIDIGQVTTQSVYHPYYDWDFYGLLPVSGYFTEEVKIDSGYVQLINCVLSYGNKIQNEYGNLIFDHSTIHDFSTAFYLHEHSVTSIASSILTGNTTPVYFYGPGKLTTDGGLNDISGNTYNFVNIDFENNSNWTMPYLPIPYHIQDNLNSFSKLTIESGNVIKLKHGNYIHAYNVHAVAKPGEYIYFTSINDDNWGGDSNNDGNTTSPSSKDWGGIGVYDSSLLKRVKIRYAGYNNYAALRMNQNSVADSCEISSSYVGIQIYSGSPVVSYTTIATSEYVPVSMSPYANPVFINNTFSFSDNQFDVIHLIVKDLNQDAVLKPLAFNSEDNNVPYLITEDLTINLGKTLKLMPGVILKSQGNHNIIVNGSLIAEGKPDSLIVITSARDDNYGKPGDSNKDGTNTSPDIGDFGGIFFTPTSGDSSLLKNCLIRYTHAGSRTYYSRTMGGAGIITVNSSPAIDSCEFKDMEYGIKSYEASFPVITHNRMVNIQYTPFNIDGSADPTFSGNTFNNVGWNALGLLGGILTQNGTIRKKTVADYVNITYVLFESLTIADNTYIDVEPGVVIKFSGNYTRINVKGGFKTVGTSDERIVFTSTSDDNVGNPKDTNGDGNGSSPAKGNWGRITFEETSDDSYCKLEYLQMNYSGYTNNYSYNDPTHGSIELIHANTVINHVEINASDGYGIKIAGNSSPLISNTSIQNSNDSPIGMSLLSDPVFSNMTFAGNFDKHLAILEGHYYEPELSSDVTLKKRDVAGFNPIPYRLSNLTVGSNATLTIDPGVIIKTGAHIRVYGALKAQGLSNQKIIITSTSDDSAGGDSNDDGNTSSPSPGNWSGITFYASGIDHENILSNCDLRYGSRVLEFDDAYAHIDSSIIQLSSDRAFRIFGSSDPLIENNQIYNIRWNAVHMSMFAKPIFNNNTVANVEYIGISIEPENYSGNDTIPIRSFAGIDSITYYMSGTYIVNQGATLTILPGTVFKSFHNYGSGNYEWDWTRMSFEINGTLNIMGEAGNPVIFTSYYDDTYGYPRDMGQDGNYFRDSKYSTLFIFNNISSDTSLIRHTIIKHVETAIECNSASPVIINNRFEHIQRGISFSGVSEPILENNVFHDLDYSPMEISLVAFPSSYTGNVISGTTLRVIDVRDETLTNDVTLIKRNFGGHVNIPYRFYNYNIGTSAILTIEPGVVCKVSGSIDVYKGLIAKGGKTPDSTIVFTVLGDDFYGGDSNADSTETDGTDNYWGGINFRNESIDDYCELDHVIMRYGWHGGLIELENASPTIRNTMFLNSQNGVIANGSSNPVINDCDFVNIAEYAIENTALTFTIDATENWWGSNSGPAHSGNSGGSGVIVSDGVNYTPWKSHGAFNPVAGDVSLNGFVQAYDASLVLQHVVELDTLNEIQLNIADVSSAEGVSAYDASLILQFAVGKIQTFPAEYLKSAGITNVDIQFDEYPILPGMEINIPMELSGVENMKSLQAAFNFDPGVVQLEKIDFTSYAESLGMLSNFSNATGKIIIAGAATDPLNQNGRLANLVFRVNSNLDYTESFITANHFSINEKDIRNVIEPIRLYYANELTGVNHDNEQNTGVFSIYPNPVADHINISFNLTDNTEQLTVGLYNMNGELLKTLCNVNKLNAGKHSINLNIGSNIDNGVYILKLVTQEFTENMKFIVNHR